jgi:hypothetical protein
MTKSLLPAQEWLFDKIERETGYDERQNDRCDNLFD